MSETAAINKQFKNTRAGVLAGLAAGVAMVIFLVAMRLLLARESLLEYASDWFTAVTPPAVFDFLLSRLLTKAKPLLLLGMVLVILGLAAGVGATYAWLAGRRPGMVRRPFRAGALTGLVVWAFIGAVLAPLFGVGFFGVDARSGGPVGFNAATLVYSLVFGVVLATVYAASIWGDLPGEPGVDQGRRRFLARALMVGGGVALAGGGVRVGLEALARSTPARFTPQQGTLPPEVTPIADFYRVSKNILDPEVDRATWQLRVEGEFAQKTPLTHDDLTAMPAVEQYVTLECISNPVGGELMSNALWRGVRLRDVLDRLQPSADTRRIAFHSADGYSESLPIADAMDPDVMLVYGMNGEPLPDKNGGPLRVLVPGRYGMKSPKWLERIQATPDVSFRGYWEKRGWSDSAVVKPTSRLDVPGDEAEIGLEPQMLGGVAFGGARGVSEVECSADYGATWFRARVRKPLSKYTWVLWTSEWKPPTASGYALWVRCKDGSGVPQEAEARDSHPDGASGYHEILVTVTRPAA